MNKLLTHYRRAMITPRHDINSLCQYWIIRIMHSVVHQDLICAFTGLSLHTVHETTSENDDLLAEDYAGVAVSSDDAVIGAVVYLLPVGFVCACHESCDLVVTYVILTTN